MEATPNNTDRNVLGKSVNEAGLIAAIEESGYPLQGVVATHLDSRFLVIEEIGFIDREKGEHRSLDLYAWKLLSDQAFLRPQVSLLIECKRSRQPFVFFKSVLQRCFPEFPTIAGLPRVELKSMDGKSSIHAHPAQLIGLWDDAFMKESAASCAVVSAAELKGERVKLSGDVSYNELIRPLCKAVDHFKERSSIRFKSRARAELITCVAVLDAPMVLVESPSQASHPKLCPWIRVFRGEAGREKAKNGEGEISYTNYFVDVVHASYFPCFINDWLMPFLQRFAERADSHADILTSGGRVDNLHKWEWTEVARTHTAVNPPRAAT